MNRTPAIAALLFAAVTLACGGDKPPSPAPPTPAGGATTSVAAPAAPATATAGIPPAAGTSTGGDIGIAECDDFLRKYEACVSQHVPAASKAQFEQGMTQWRTAWKSMAAQPSARPSLVAACQQAMASTKMATSAYGCTW
jgi:hypothetical protein